MNGIAGCIAPSDSLRMLASIRHGEAHVIFTMHVMQRQKHVATGMPS